MKYTPHIIIATILSFVARYANAQEAPFIGRGLDSGAYNLLTPLPGLGPKVTELSDYLQAMFNIGLGLAAVFAVVMIVYGGFEYIWSATPFGKSTGKQKIQEALIGLAMAFGAVLILQTIDPNLTKFSLKIDPLRVNIKPAATRNDQIDQLYIRLGQEAKVERQAYDEFVKQANAKKAEAEQLRTTGQTPEERAANEERAKQIDREVVAIEKAAREKYIKSLYETNIKSSYQVAINENTPEGSARARDNMLRQYRILTDELRATNADPELIQNLQLETNFRIYALDTKIEADKIGSIGTAFLNSTGGTFRGEIAKLKEIDKKVDTRYASAKVRNPESAEQIKNDTKGIIQANINLIKTRCGKFCENE
ncbi:MAG TPA: pilin [Candidatus Paceibacterota bacterium]